MNIKISVIKLNYIAEAIAFYNDSKVMLPSY